MKKLFILCLCFVIQVNNKSLANSKWGEDYFPNIQLINQDGEKLHFFDDLIKDKIVVINFIYTSCPDVCPLETAQLTRVQRIVGDRLGKDIFFYSISIDPEIDTPEVLKEYRERFGAKWMFFTGNKEEIITIRRKLGLYIEDIEGGENNHNVSMIIGNQKTGRWMKKSPFENAYVLADQIGNWLTGWKSPQVVKDYANAPILKNLSDGENIFRTRCESCHSINGKDEKRIGPDLLNVVEKRDRRWLIRWLRQPDVMLKEKDPLAMSLLKQYNNVVMPNLSLTQVDVMDLIKFMQIKSDEINGKVYEDELHDSHDGHDHDKPTQVGTSLVINNAWVKPALPGATVNAGYLSMVNFTNKSVTLNKVESESFETIEIHNMSMENGSMNMEHIPELLIPAKGKVVLKPGNMHLMLINPVKDHFEGDKITVMFLFESGESQTITIPVVDKS